MYVLQESMVICMHHSQIAPLKSRGYIFCQLFKSIFTEATLDSQENIGVESELADNSSFSLSSGGCRDVDAYSYRELTTTPSK